MSDYKEEMAAFSVQKVLLAFDFEREEVLDHAAAQELFEVASHILDLASYEDQQIASEMPEGLVYNQDPGFFGVTFKGVGISAHDCGDVCGCQYNGITIAGRRVKNTPWGYSFN